MKLHHLPRPAAQLPHPALQPGAQGQGTGNTKLLKRHENNEHHHALTALGSVDHRARTSSN